MTPRYPNKGDKVTIKTAPEAGYMVAGIVVTDKKENEVKLTNDGDGSFGAGDPLTCEQLATILYSYERSKGGGFTGAWMFRLDYADINQISEWAYEPMCWMTMKGVIGGKDGGILDPKGFATRAEGAQVLMRYLLSQDS